VRIHRQGEGAPYTGLAPAGTPVDPAVAAVDQALATGNADALVRTVTGSVDQGLRQRFARAAEARRHAAASVDEGRSYVAAYVELTHYAERLLEAAGTGAAPHAGEPHANEPHPPAAEHRH
jgi:hypothetical protein